jgi:hypothetical protein
MVHKNNNICCIVDDNFVALPTYSAQQNINCLQMFYQVEI